jgi:hypothetical protein
MNQHATHCRSIVGRFWIPSAILLSVAIVWGVQAQQPASLNREGGINVSQGELIYVPIYSSIFYENGKQTLELAATLSIHNVNLDRTITIARADYYDTAGRLLKKSLENPLTLGPLQTTNFVIDRTNTAGGTGANFVVEWHSKQDVTSPLVEAVMINASSNLGIAFTTTGKVIRQSAPAGR